MAKRKSIDQQTPATEPTTPEKATPAAQDTAPATLRSAETVAGQAASPPVAAPAKEGPADVVDNRLGSRREISTDTGNVQIRFSKRPDGGRPDDELLEPVRGQQPDVKWQSREQSWQA